MNTKSERLYPFGGNTTNNNGSDMPIDTSMRAWTWRNPLNVLPAGLLVLLVVGIVEMLLA